MGSALPGGRLLQRHGTGTIGLANEHQTDVGRCRSRLLPGGEQSRRQLFRRYVSEAADKDLVLGNAKTFTRQRPV